MPRVRNKHIAVNCSVNSIYHKIKIVVHDRWTGYYYKYLNKTLKLWKNGSSL